MARLSVTLLGVPEVRHGGRIVAFPTRKTLALLVYLLVAGGFHARAKLIALLWPEGDEGAHRVTLRSTLVRLRGALAETAGGSHFVVERNVVGFDFSSDFELDLQQLQSAYELARTTVRVDGLSSAARRTLVAQLQATADLWRGPFLEGFSVDGAPEFDDWASVQREVWRQRIEAVLDRLSQLYMEQGMTTNAGDTVARWLSLNPLDERAHQRIMQCHFAAGDRAAALRAYEACRAVLTRELDTDPAPETEALAERIRAAGPFQPLRITPRVPATLRPEGTRPHLVEAPLVGRVDQFATLVELYHVARHGRPQAVLLQGEAGIGKTRLGLEFLGWVAAQGADVLQGRAFETGGRLPYQPLVDAIRPRVERENAPTDLLTDVWLTELSRLLPELHDRYPDLPLPTGDETAARTRLFEALARLGQALAERAPVVLFVDDLQWADAASLDVLHYAGRRWAANGTPVLMLLSMRSDALHSQMGTQAPALREWLGALGRDLPLAQLRLTALTAENTLQLIQALAAVDSPDPWTRPSGGAEQGRDTTPAPSGFFMSQPPRAAHLVEFSRWLFTETGGQPFFVTETLRALLERGELVPRPRDDGAWALDVQPRLVDEIVLRGFLPPGVRELISARLARLAPAARELLAAAAVLGQAFTFEELCRIADLGEHDALPRLDEVVQAQLLRETAGEQAPLTPGRYFFAHDKIRHVVYMEAGDPRRRVFHRRALEAREDAGAAAAELAHHALAAGLEEPALRFSLAAGDDAMRVLAARDAIAHYEQAIASAERLGRRDLLADLHARRGKAFVRMAMWADAKRELEAALEGLGTDQSLRRAEILVDLSEACWWLLDVPGMRSYATEAVALAEQMGRGDLETKAIAWLAGVGNSDGNVRSCIDQCERAVARAQELGIAPPAQALTTGSLSLYWLGRLDEAAAWSRKAVELARSADDVAFTVQSLPHLGLALAGRGRYDEAVRVFEEARRLGREYGIERLLARSIAMSAGFHLDLFDFAGAEVLAQEAREHALALNFLPPAVSAGIDLLLTFARRQEVARTEKLVDEVAEVVVKAADFHGWLWRLRLAEARAEIALARGDRAETLRWATETIEQSHARGRLKYQVLGLNTRAQGLLAVGRTEDALSDLRTALTLARSVDAPALFLRVAISLLSVDGDDALLAEARAVAERIAGALPDDAARCRFQATELVRMLARTA